MASASRGSASNIALRKAVAAAVMTCVNEVCTSVPGGATSEEGISPQYPPPLHPLTSVPPPPPPPMADLSREGAVHILLQLNLGLPL